MKSGSGKWIAIFLSMIFLPTFLWVFVSQIADTTNYEKRVLAVKPTYQDTGYQQYATAYDMYYTDHLPFRNYLLQLYSLVEFRIFKESFADDVQIGKDNWMFYHGENEAAMQDYTGMNLFSEEMLGLIRQNLLDTEAYLKARDIEFVLFIAPNKESVYGEYLPDYIQEDKTELTRAMQLVSYLRATTDLRIVFPLQEILDEKSEHILYCKYDSHWNNLGAYIGTRELLKELGVSMPPLTELTITATNDAPIDLAEEIGLMYYVTDKLDYSVSGYNNNTFELALSDDSGFATYYRYTSDAADTRTVLMNRDSFANAMIPYFASSFKEVYMPNYYYFSPDVLEDEKPDVFVFEVAERRLSILTSFYMKEAE
ncbi:MAG: alginate O-acetyltransferase AlgX-related protein [Lachnospiraceae bacterium]